MKTTLTKKTRRHKLTSRNRLIRILQTAAKETKLATQTKPLDAVGIVLLDADAITEVNEAYLQHQGPTDVITFDYRSDDAAPGEGEEVSAEILVCLDVAQEAAASHGSTFSEEVVLYCVHGMLHLAGYDDHAPADVAAMRAAETTVMDALRSRHNLHNLFADEASAVSTKPKAGAAAVSS